MIRQKLRVNLFVPPKPLRKYGENKYESSSFSLCSEKFTFNSCLFDKLIFVQLLYGSTSITSLLKLETPFFCFTVLQLSQIHCKVALYLFFLCLPLLQP